MIAVVDYGVGNLYSLLCSLEKIGAEAQVTGDPQALAAAGGIILPGVGAFGDAAQKLRQLKLDRALKELAKKGKPLLGICLGMQLLFDRSLEYGEHEGLGLIPGVIRPLRGAVFPDAKVPHMGWNSLRVSGRGEALVKQVPDGAFVYYVHSYYATDCEPFVAASSDHGGVSVPGVVRRGTVCGTQFHPEKSGETGLRMLRAFAKEGGKNADFPGD